jgi:hypothetical protein
MRKLVIGASMLGLCGFAALGPAQAREYPWCLQLGALPSGTFASPAAPARPGDFSRLLHLVTDAGGGRNCGFDSYDQCMRARIGLGGWCEPNLFFRPDPVQRAPHRRGRG